MRNIFFVIISFLLLVSCEENFQPFGDLQTQYALTCILRGDTTFQIAALSKTYANTNYDPYSNKVDPSVKGALIRIWNGDSVAVFRDTTILRPIGSSYQIPYNLYYTKKFTLDPNYKVEIEAILPNGVRLTSSVNAPNQIIFSYVDRTVPASNKSTVDFRWNPGAVDNAYLTRVSIYYYLANDPKKTTHVAYVPLKYVFQDGTYYAIDPKPTNANTISIDVETISRTLELISHGDSNKKNYVILGPFLEVVSFDKSLSTYFNSIERANDAYSVNLNEVDYSNIKGGLGIFGIYMRNYWSFDFSYDYIKSFGYTPASSNP